MKLVDNFLNSTSQYRLVLYYLSLLFLTALGLSSFSKLSFGPIELVILSTTCLAVCFTTNTLFSKIAKVATNFESPLISALIFALLLQPPRSLPDLGMPILLCIFAMAGKYLINFKGKHIFNPVAISLAFALLFFGFSAAWYIAAPVFLPVVLLGILIVKKLKRFTLFLTYVGVFAASSFILTGSLTDLLALGAYLFFAFIMLTEPRTTPPTRPLQIIYGAIAGVLSTPFLHFGAFTATPELALVIANAFSFIISPKYSLKLRLKEKNKLTDNIFSFIFNTTRPVTYNPGQFMEWTLDLNYPDSRGNRRYFTLASSPTEIGLMITVKFAQDSSKFKEHLLNLSAGEQILASSLSGDFILPKDASKKLTFIAGGIGITPFRSMLKFLLDTKQSRDIVLFYSCLSSKDFVFKDLIEESSKLGVRIYFAITDTNSIPSNWIGIKGFINESILKKEVSDYKARTFYLSGPPSMVDSFKTILKSMQIPQTQIKTDYFPGYV